MKKPFISRMYWVIAIAWAIMILAKGYMGALMAELVIRGIIAVTAALAFGTLMFIIFASRQISASSMRHLADGSTACAKAIIGIVFMASGFTAIGWAFIALAVVRAGVSFWAEEHVNRVL